MNHKGSVSYVCVIEKDYPGYLHELYRYATKVVGHKSSFAVIAMKINEKSRVSSENRISLHLSKDQVNNWFKKMEGKSTFQSKKPSIRIFIENQG